MDLFYEIIQKDDNLPVKAFIHSVDKFETHWHKELEILICLEGSVKVNKKDDIYILKKDQFIIINKNEPHSIRKTARSAFPSFVFQIGRASCRERV